MINLVCIGNDGDLCDAAGKEGDATDHLRVMLKNQLEYYFSQ